MQFLEFHFLFKINSHFFDIDVALCSTKVEIAENPDYTQVLIELRKTQHNIVGVGRIWHHYLANESQIDDVNIVLLHFVIQFIFMRFWMNNKHINE